MLDDFEPLTDAQVQAGARPGESWEAALRRMEEARMPTPNHPATLYRAQDQIATIAGAESYATVELLSLWARGYVEALFAEGLIDWDEHGRLNAAVDDQRDRRKAELTAAEG